MESGPRVSRADLMVRLEVSVKHGLVLGLLLFLGVPLLAQQAVPKIPYQANPNFLKLPAGMYLGEAADVQEGSGFRRGMAVYRGAEAVSLRVVKQPTAEALSTAQAVV